MEFRIAHRFPCSPQTYWETSHDPDYERRSRGDDVDTELLETTVEDTVTIERRRVSPRRPLPPLMAKAIGRDRLSYVQEVRFDNASYSTVWKVLSDVLPDKVRCSGTSRVVAIPGGCERVIEGKIEVHVFMVGGAIEKHILEQLQRGYDNAAAMLTNLLPGTA